MKIQAGHFYRTRGGTIVGPMSLSDNHWFWSSPQHLGNHWYAAGNPSNGRYDGRIHSTNIAHPDDIVSEINLFDIRFPFMFLDGDIQAFLETTEAPLEVLTDEGWETVSTIEYSHLVYRIQRTPDYTPMTIPWEVINPEFCYAAKDGDGTIWVYSGPPEVEGLMWCEGELQMNISDLLQGVDPGTVPWDKSLQERPA